MIRNVAGISARPSRTTHKEPGDNAAATETFPFGGMSERPSGSQPRPPRASPLIPVRGSDIMGLPLLGPVCSQIIHTRTSSKVSECCSRHILQSRPPSVLKEHRCELEVSTAKLLSPPLPDAWDVGNDLYGSISGDASFTTLPALGIMRRPEHQNTGPAPPLWCC